MKQEIHYTFANCEPTDIITVMHKLSEIIKGKFDIKISATNLADRFIAESNVVGIGSSVTEEDGDFPPVAAHYAYGDFFRSDLKVMHLELSYLKSLCFTIARNLKSTGALKVGGNQLFSMLTSALGFKSHQAFEAVKERSKPVTPKFITVKFDEKGQDFNEFIIVDGLIVDCQPYGSFIWCGLRGSIEDKKNTGRFRIYTDKKYAKSKDFNIYTQELAQNLNYLARSKETPQDYQDGFMDAVFDRKNEDKYSSSEQYQYGYNVGVWNAGNSPDFKESLLGYPEDQER